MSTKRLGVTEGDACPTCGAGAGDSCRLPVGQNCLHPSITVTVSADPRLSCEICREPSIALAPRHTGGDVDVPAHWVPVCQSHLDRWFDDVTPDERLPVIPRFGLALFVDQARNLLAAICEDNGDFRESVNQEVDGLHESVFALEVGLRAYDNPATDTER